ncbi:hypothetical protein NHX12_020589, partial [Muraenolepis orangiensis]
MSFFGYRRELSKYEDVDEDELLASLSPEELAELEKELSDIDPDANVPTGLRQRDQTDKTPTGTFSRDALMKYWECETRKLMEDEIGGGSPKPDGEQEAECVTENSSEAEDEQDEDTEKERKISVFEKVEDEDEEEHEDQDEESEEEEELETEEEEEEEEEEELVTEEEEEEEAKEEEESKSKPEQPKEPALLTQTADCNATGNPTVVDDVLERILSDDPELTEVNLNNIDDISQENLIRFAEALRSNSHVRTFSLANTRADDPVALAIAKTLRENSSIVSINVESNYVSGKGVMALVQALPHNHTLTELRFHNQRHMCGGQVEMEMVKILRENHTLIKLGYQFNLPGPRMSMTGILTRNQDHQRQKRVQEQRLQNQQEPAGGDRGGQKQEHFLSPGLPLVLTQTPSEQRQRSKEEGAAAARKKAAKPTRTIAAVIRAHEEGGRAGGAVGKKPRGEGKRKKGKKSKEKRGPEATGETGSILKELKNALRP